VEVGGEEAMCGREMALAEKAVGSNTGVGQQEWIPGTSIDVDCRSWTDAIEIRGRPSGSFAP